MGCSIQGGSMCRNVIAALMFLLVAIAQTAGQQANDSTCSAAMARSLTIRGIHLGMSTDELFALFPGARENESIKPALERAKQAPNFGATNFQIMPSWYATKARSEGVA